MTKIVPITDDFHFRQGAGAVAAHEVKDIEQLAFELRTLHRRIGDVSWALDKGLIEFEDIDPEVLARRVLRAARLVRALEGISLE